MEDDFWRKTTFNGRQSLMEEDFDGRHPLMEDYLRWQFDTEELIYIKQNKY